MKTCTKCKQTKPLTEYTRKRKDKPFLRPECNECKRERTRLWYNTIPQERVELIYENQRLYRKKKAVERSMR